MKITSTHVYFWGGIYSNFHPATFKLFGIEFNCSEQAFMWSKAYTFGDMQIAEKILQKTQPLDQKKLGRKIKDFDSLEWDKVKYEIMLQCVSAKFYQNEELKQELISTKDKIIVEASPYDKIWGVGLSEDDPLILDETNWKGQNLLGKVLMHVRSEFVK